MKPVARIVAGLLLLAGALASFADTLSIGMPAPSINVSKWVKGAPVKELKKGNLYVVEFWATWCGPCRESIPHLTQLAKKFKDKVTFVGVSVFEKDQALVKPFVKQMGEKMDYHVAMDLQSSPTARDSGFMAKNWMEAAGQDSIPTAFVIDKERNVAWIGHPMMLDGVLEKVVAGKFDAKQAAKEQADQRAEEQKRMDAVQNSPVVKQIRKIGDLLKAKNYPEALKEIDVLEPMDASPLPIKPKEVATFMRLQVYTENGDSDAFYKTAEIALDLLKTNDQGLNQIAWVIVDPASKLARKDYDFALKVALQANELSKYKDSNELDTLAWAYFGKGDKANAIKWEKEAIALAPTTSKAEFEATLKKFEG